MNDNMDAGEATGFLSPSRGGQEAEEVEHAAAADSDQAGQEAQGIC